MIEANAFLATFAVQILAMSFVFPARLIRYSRQQSTGVTTGQLSQLYPGVDHELASNRFQSQLRVGSSALGVIGLLALGWLFSYMRQPNWRLGPVIAVVSVYCMLQYLPILLAAWKTYRLYKAHELSSTEGKRTATLKRRELFDFISPSAVILALLAYFLFVAYVLYLQQEPHPGFTLIGFLTFIYAFQAFDLYRVLYGKKHGPLDSNALRAHRTGFAVKLGVYLCILNAVFFALVFTIDLLDQKRWVPFAVSAFFVTLSLLMSTGMTSLLRKSSVSVAAAQFIDK